MNECDEKYANPPPLALPTMEYHYISPDAFLLRAFTIAVCASGSEKRGHVIC